MEPETVQCCVTSPPYWGLRDYRLPPLVWGGEVDCAHEWGDLIPGSSRGGSGTPTDKNNRGEGYGRNAQRGTYCQVCSAWLGSLGLEPTPEEYVEHIVEVMRGVWRVLRPNAIAWVNLGDSYAGTGKSGGGKQGDRWERCGADKKGPRGGKWSPPPPGLKRKDLVGIPWRVAFALQADGWWLRSDVIWCLSGGTRVYARTQKGDHPMTIKDLVRLDPTTVKLWNGEQWTQALGWSLSPRAGDEIEFELRSGERIGCTPGHQWPTARGLLRAGEVRTGDIIDTARLPEPDEVREPSALNDYSIGWFVGLYIAEGSQSNGTIQISSHKSEVDRFDRLRALAMAYDGYIAIHDTSDNGCSVNINSPVLFGVLDAYVAGHTAKNKHLHTRCWRRSDTFLRNVLRGYLDGDGHYDEKNDRWCIRFCSNDNLANDLRTIGGRLSVSVRVKRAMSMFDGREFPGYRGQIRFRTSEHHNAKSDSEVIAIRGSRARRFWDIGVADDPHTFALASGVMTHNSKPNPLPEPVKDRPTKSHEYLFLLAKSRRYYYDGEAVRTSLAAKTATTYGSSRRSKGGGVLVKADNLARDVPVRRPRIGDDDKPVGANLRSVWSIATRGYPGVHFATFPPALVEPCILAGSRVGDLVLDPFAGAGTTGVVANRWQRRFVGLELSPEYAEMAQSRIANDAPLFTGVT